MEKGVQTFAHLKILSKLIFAIKSHEIGKREYTNIYFSWNQKNLQTLVLFLLIYFKFIELL